MVNIKNVTLVIQNFYESIGKGKYKHYIVALFMLHKATVYKLSSLYLLKYTAFYENEQTALPTK